MKLDDAKLEIFTAVKIQIKVFQAVMPWSVAAGYRHYGASYLLIYYDNLMTIHSCLLFTAVVSQSDHIIN
jgi:hypothetical protein